MDSYGTTQPQIWLGVGENIKQSPFINKTIIVIGVRAAVGESRCLLRDNPTKIGYVDEVFLPFAACNTTTETLPVLIMICLLEESHAFMV